MSRNTRKLFNIVTVCGSLVLILLVNLYPLSYLHPFRGSITSIVYTGRTHKTLARTIQRQTRLYIHSVNIKEKVNNNVTIGGKIIVTAWIHRDIMRRDIICCVLLINSTVITIKAKTVMPYFITLDMELPPMILYCHFEFKSSNIKGINVKLSIQTCPAEDDSYVVPNLITSPEHRDIGVCGKIVYGDIDGNRLIEWFEFLKLVGVDRAVVTPYNITTELTNRVLRLYQINGFIEITSPFDFPEKDILPRNVGDKVPQAFADERVVLIDCLARLINFKYIAVMDPDEFMIPQHYEPKASWKYFLENYFTENVAGLVFPVVYHIQSFKPQNESSSLLMDKHQLGSSPLFDRFKNIIRTERFLFESVSTHAFEPFNDFKRVHVKPAIATLHHYRKCRKEWKKETKLVKNRSNFPKLCSSNGTICSDLCSQSYPVIQRYVENIQDKVMESKQLVNR